MITDTGKDVILIMPIPEYPIDAAKCFVRSKWLGRSGEECARPAADVLKRIAVASEIVRRVASHNRKVRIVEVESLFCGGTECKPWEGNDDLLYYDNNHLNLRGALLLQSAIKDALDG
jgi:hypothetical protein